MSNHSDEASDAAAAFMLQFSEEPEHVSVILACSRIDELLGILIRSRLLPCPAKNDQLLESERGLGTFSNRIDLAYRLGLIPNRLSEVLHLLRKIRNDFAHTYTGQRMDSSPHTDRLMEALRLIKIEGDMPVVRKGMRLRNPMLSQARENFTILAIVIIGSLEMATRIVQSVDNTLCEKLKVLRWFD
jgi:hypothetical protein